MGIDEEAPVMPATAGGNWIEHLTPARCWDLLAGSPAGRIGVLNDSAPEIYPVNHAVDGRSIVFRTDPGTKLRGLTRTPRVCFEVDGIDPEEAGGWSVLVKGRAVEVDDPDELRRLTRLPLLHWALGEKTHWVRVVPDDVTGRRIWNRATSRTDKEQQDGGATADDS
jgi:nitroimidazol reductase NimA-like FMN-containing flavoprotein (pyridoxamine 5'-phosphate oxidase superfamily)